jgi:hypothetical protein
MESAGVDAGENMLADPGAAPACAKAASVIPMQSQAEALQNNFPGPRLKLKTLFSQLASDVFVVWLHDVCCQDSGLPQGQLYDFFGDGMIAAHAKFVKKFCGPDFPESRGHLLSSAGFRRHGLRRRGYERRFTWFIHLFRQRKPASFAGARLHKLLKK